MIKLLFKIIASTGALVQRVFGISTPAIRSKVWASIVKSTSRPNSAMH